MADLTHDEYVEKNTGVKGWLLVFCIVLTILWPSWKLYSLITSYIETQPSFGSLSGWIFYVDGFFKTVLIILSVGAGIALWSVRPKAVPIAKNYLLIFLAYTFITVLLPFIASGSEVHEEMVVDKMKATLLGIGFFAVWYSYLNVSDRVKYTYRKIKPSTDETKSV